MAEWWTYEPQDFLLFAPETYWRLFQLENAAHWPLPLVNLLIGLGVLALLLHPQPWSGRAVSAALAAAWAWVGWSFVGTRYAAINWSMDYVEPAFYAQGALISWLGLVRNRLDFAARDGPALAGLALYIYALALHPLAALVSERPFAGAEVVGIAPDPTAIATLGLVVTLPRSWAAPLLLAVPLGWCLTSWATLATMGAWQAWIPLAAAVAALGARAWAALRPRPSPARPGAR